MAWGTKRLYFWMIDIWAIIPCSRSCRNYLKQQVRGGGGGVGAAATLFDFFQRNPNQSQRSNIQDTCMILTFLVPLVLFLWTTPPGSGTASDTWELIYRVLLYIYRGESTRWYWYGGKRRKKIRVPRWDLKHPKVFPFREKFKFLLLCGRASAEIPCT